MRKRLLRGALALGAILVGAVGSSSAFGQGLPPSGEWEYREEAESCRAYRAFGVGPERVLLQLRSFGPGSAIEAMVVSSALPNEPFSARLVELSWDDGEWDMFRSGMLGSVSGLPTVTIQLAHRPVSALFEGFTDKTVYFVSSLEPAAETMRLRVVGAAPIDLQTGPLEQPLARLMECEKVLTAKWGWGRNYQEGIASAPDMRDKDSFYSVIVYPAAQLLNRVGGILQLRLKIDADGKVAECTVQSSPGSSLFGSESCKAIRRKVRYTPARDHQGRAVESLAQISITFARYD